MAALGDDERDGRNEGGTQARQGRNHPCGQPGLLALLRRRGVGCIGLLGSGGLRDGRGLVGPAVLVGRSIRLRRRVALVGLAVLAVLRSRSIGFRRGVGLVSLIVLAVLRSCGVGLRRRSGRLRRRVVFAGLSVGRSGRILVRIGLVLRCGSRLLVLYMHGDLDALLGRLDLAGNLDVGASHELLSAGNIPHHGLLARLAVRPAHLDGGGQIGHRAGLNLKSLGCGLRHLNRRGLGRPDLDRRRDGVGQALDGACDLDGAGLGGVGRAPGDGLVGHVAVGPGDGHGLGQGGLAAHPDLLGLGRLGADGLGGGDLDGRAHGLARFAHGPLHLDRSALAAGQGRELGLAGLGPGDGLLGHRAVRPGDGHGLGQGRQGVGGRGAAGHGGHYGLAVACRHGLGGPDLDRRRDGVGQALDGALHLEGAGLGGVGLAPGDGLVGHVAVGPDDGHGLGQGGLAAHPDLLGRHRFGGHHCRRFNLNLCTGRNARLANHTAQRERSAPAAGKRSLLLTGKRAPCDGLLGHAAIRPAYRGSGRQCRKKGVGIHLAARDIELHILPLDACDLERLDRHLRRYRAGKALDRTCGRKRPGSGGVKLVPGHRLIAHVAVGPGDGQGFRKLGSAAHPDFLSRRHIGIHGHGRQDGHLHRDVLAQGLHGT